MIRKAALDRPELALTYGNFIQAVIDFVLIAIVVFMIVRALHSSVRERELLLKKAEQEAAGFTTRSAGHPRRYRPSDGDPRSVEEGQ